MNRAGSVKAGGLQGEVSPVARLPDKAEESAEIDMAFSHREDLEVIPVHISPAVVVHVVMADMIFRVEPFVFLFIQKIQLAVEIRHLGIKDKVNIRINLPERFPVGHGVPVADHVFHQEVQAVLRRGFCQSAIFPDIVPDV